MDVDTQILGTRVHVPKIKKTKAIIINLSIKTVKM